MSWLKTNCLVRLKNRVWSVAFLAFVLMLSTVHVCSAQAMQKGISVELASTSSAVPVPEADSQDALVIAVTDTGRIYFGIDPVTPDSLGEKLKARLSRTKNLYIKADARAPYACVVKVLDAVHTAGVAGVTLLTTQPKSTPVGAVVLPTGIEMELARHSPGVTK